MAEPFERQSQKRSSSDLPVMSRLARTPRWYWLLGTMLATSIFMAMVIATERWGGLRGGTAADIYRFFALSTDRAWGLVTFPFLHAFQAGRDLIHFIVTMLALIIVSPDLEGRLGARGYLALFFVSAIGAGLAHLVLTLTVLGGEETRWALGASGGVYGLLVAYWRYFPRQRPIPLVQGRILVLGLCAILLLAGFASTWEKPESGIRVEYNTQVSGIAFGLCFILLAPRIGRLRARRETARQIRGVLQDTEMMARTDEILDKIAREGMDSLSRSERRHLRRASRRYRGLLHGGEKPGQGEEDR
jgi:membrane associated rhomboid family serine protease